MEIAVLCIHVIHLDSRFLVSDRWIILLFTNQSINPKLLLNKIFIYLFIWHCKVFKVHAKQQ